MLKKAGVWTCGMAMLVLLGPIIVQGEDSHPNHVGGKFGIYGQAGYALYAMGDFNNMMNASQDEITADSQLSGFSGTTTGTLRGGLTYGGAVQYAFSNYLAIGVQGGILTAPPAKISRTITETYYDPYRGFVTETDTASGDLSFSAYEIGPVIRGYLPAGRRWLFNASLGLEYISASMAFRLRETYEGVDTTINYSGQTLGGTLTLGGEFFFAPWISLGIDFGYRLADVKELKTGSLPPNVIQTRNCSLDYSGPLAQGGLHLYF